MSLAQPAIPSPYIHSSVKRRKNTWYTIASGNWTDPNIWISSAMSFCQTNFNYPSQAVPSPIFPAVGDDVSIGFGHTVTCNTSVNLNNLYVAGSLIFDSTARTISIAGDIQATGTVNMSNGAHNLLLYGVNNYIVNFTSGTSGTVNYIRSGDQNIMNLSYRNLTLDGSGNKFPPVSMIIAGNLIIGTGSTTTTGKPTLELGNLNLTVNGTTTVSSSLSTVTGGQLSKSGSGSLLFVGLFQWINGNAVVDFSVGNPTLEFRGGITQTNGSPNQFKTGTGLVSFTTNSQAITAAGAAGYIIFNGSILISGTINVTVTSGGSAYQIYVNTVNGDNAASTFTIGANGQVYLLTATLPMTTGVFSYNSLSTATIGFAFSGNYTIPYTSFGGLAIGSLFADTTGTKTLSGNTSIAGNLTVNNPSSTSSQNILELATFDLTVSGTTTIVYQISKTGAGSVVMVGLLNLSTNTINPDIALNFTGGATLELRGGFTGNSGMTSSGLVSLTTNNQTFTAIGTVNFNCSILISGAITATHSTTNSTLVFKSPLNGNNAASTFDNRGTVNYQATQQPMLTGVLQTNLAANTFIYNAAGNQDVKGGTYRTLTLAGSGVKTLQGNVVVATLYTLTPPATLNTNGFTRT